MNIQSNEEEVPLISGGSNNNLHLSGGDLYKSWQWWERPQEAQGTVQHISLAPSESSSGSVQEGSAIAETEHPVEIGSLAPRHQEKKLGQLMSTAISGNDITSSVLYVSGYAAFTCGMWAPLALILVALLLALFRPIYTEVVTALPMNGGTYNVLLNTTSKRIASVAGALSLLSYVATAVVSATSAIEYLKTLWNGLNLDGGVIFVLGIFALLNLLGITESAVVAVVLFVVHCTTLFVLIIMSCIKFFPDFSVLENNWNGQFYNGTYVNGTQVAEIEHDWLDMRSIPILSIYLGFGASMLGITGFETSANFVEQQEPGVFPKTLRNMWFAVAFFNPVICFLAFGILPIDVVMSFENVDSLLAIMAEKAGGTWLLYWVSIDAVLVLSGAVLTAYVGVIGLARRLALDRILPQFLLQENKLRHTNHWIIIVFFLLCSSLFFIVNGQVDMLSSVYTAAFLCVMSMFAVGNMLLKYKRGRLPRELVTPWPIVIFAFFGVVAAFISNILGDPTVLLYFGIYFVGTMLLFLLMFLRISILKILLYFCQLVIRSEKLHTAIQKTIQSLNSTKVVFFTRDDNIALLNKAILYVRDNEQTNWILIVHVYQDKADIPPKLAENCKILDSAYPKFRIDSIAVQGQFGPELVDQLSQRLNVPKNFMFITTPSGNFSHKVSDLGGVRLVTH